ncbi:MAG: hypothetical protein ACQEVA_09220 [Myxococcota bacterium]
MDVQEFEQEILKLAFETDARITTASVAYYLGIPSRKANSLLNELLEEGVLELDSDREGNLYYKVPSRASLGGDVIKRSSGDEDVAGQATEAAESSGGSEAQPVSSETFSGISFVSPTDDDTSEPISPRSSRSGFDRASGQRSEQGTTGTTSPSADGSPGQRPRNFRKQGHRAEGRDRGWTGGARAPSPVASAEAPSAVSAKPRVATMPRQESVFGGLTMRQGAPDASLDSCGGSSMVVKDTARCEPSPLPSRKPVVASCVDEEERARTDSRRQRNQENDFFRRGDRQNGMLTATAGGQVATMDNALDQPEHQPGMALLLSLILCGTGQIYNGEVSKGIMMMVLCFLLWFVLLGWVVHIWSIVDSVVVAERLNRSTG